METYAKPGPTGGVRVRVLALRASAKLTMLAEAARDAFARIAVAALCVLAVALAEPAFAQGFKPVWSDNEDGRAHVLTGPQPDYAKSLMAEYSVGGGAAKALRRGDVDGIPSTVWLTSELGKGAHDVRWRWVVDGVPQKWSGGNKVNVTAKPLTKSKTIDAFGDGSVKLTLDGNYEVGQFEDGEWYAVAPKGLKITHATPEQKGSGKKLRNGASVDLDYRRQGLDGRGQGFDQAEVMDLNQKIEPGSVLVKVKSQPDSYRSSTIDRMVTLTVLSERPPAGSFRPTVYANGGRALRNEAEIDLSRVPRIDYDPRSFPTLGKIRDWRLEQLTRPAPPLAGGSAGARKMYPADQASSYHRTQRQDLTLPAHFIMASNLTDEGERMALAKALIQREIDIMGANASAVAQDLPITFYQWTTPTVFAGTLLRDPKMRGADTLGLAPGDYSFDLQRNWKYSSWEDHEAFAALSPAEKDAFRRPFRDLDKAGSVKKDGVQVWAPLVEGRTVKFNATVEQAKDLEALGITYNGDGTWTIPAGRFSDGGLYTWGAQGAGVRLLDPDWENNTGDEAWRGKIGNLKKANSYIPQHAVQAVTMAPVLKAVAGEDYLANGTSVSGATAWELYSGYALQWMRQSPEWMEALGFPIHKPYPYQQGDRSTAGTGDGRGFNTAFIDTDYFSRWDEYAPVFKPSAPDPATRQMFTLTGTKTGFEFRLDDVPHDGWSRFTDVELRIGGGAWLSTGITQIGQVYAHDMKAGAYIVAMRAVNAFGAGRASGTKQIAAGDASAPGGGGSGGTGSPRPGGGGAAPGSGTDAPSGSPRVPTTSPRVPASAGLITTPARVSADFLQSTAAVPVPSSLALSLGALAGLGLLARRRCQRSIA